MAVTQAPDSIGRAIRARREAAGLSREQLAIAVGRGLYSVEGYELDRREPSIEIVRRIAVALGCTIGDLIPDARDA